MCHAAPRRCNEKASAARRPRQAAKQKRVAVTSKPESSRLEGEGPVPHVSAVTGGGTGGTGEREVRDYGKRGDFAAKFERENTEKRHENASIFRNLARKGPLRRNFAIPRHGEVPSRQLLALASRLTPPIFRRKTARSFERAVVGAEAVYSITDGLPTLKKAQANPSGIAKV